jgi:hypothetical protein
MKEDWWKYTLLALAAVAWWFARGEIEDFRLQNKLQWQEAAKTKECIMTDLSKTKERLAHIEGVHEAEKLYQQRRNQ